MRQMIAAGVVFALTAGAACAQVAGGTVPVQEPLRLQMPVGTSGMALSIPLPTTAVRPAPASSAETVKAAVQPPQYQPSGSPAAQQPAVAKPALKRSSVPEWPQLGQ